MNINSMLDRGTFSKIMVCEVGGLVRIFWKSSALRLSCVIPSASKSNYKQWTRVPSSRSLTVSNGLPSTTMDYDALATRRFNLLVSIHYHINE